MTGETDYRVRQAAYDLRKLRAKGLVEKPERSRRYVVPPDAARTITALSVLRDQVVSPILAGVRSPRQGASPPPGRESTATTSRSASACRPSSTTLASQQPRSRHRQLFVDVWPQGSSVT